MRCRNQREGHFFDYVSQYKSTEKKFRTAGITRRFGNEWKSSNDKGDALEHDLSAYHVSRHAVLRVVVGSCRSTVELLEDLGHELEVDGRNAVLRLGPPSAASRRKRSQLEAPAFAGNV
jgi:hypothetical protein